MAIRPFRRIATEKTMPKRDGITKRPGQSGLQISYKGPDGKRVRKKLPVNTKGEAAALRSAIVTKIATDKALGVTTASDDLFETVARRYLDYQKARISEADYERTEGIVRVHLMPRFEGRKFADITRDDLEKYINDRAVEAAAHTVKKEANKISRLWRLAVIWKLIPVNIAAQLETPPLPEDRVRYLEPAQLPDILLQCPQWLRPIVILALATGLRRGEILRIRYMDINRQQCRVYLPKVKNRKPRGVPLNETAQLALDTVWDAKAKPTDRIFPGISLNQVSVEFKRARVRANIEDFRFHDLRHTFASWLAMSGERIQVISELLGHTDIRVTMKYAHLDPAHLAPAAGKIDGVFMPELIKEEERLLTEGETEQ